MDARIEEDLRDAWLLAQGLRSDTEIHTEDEMYLLVRGFTLERGLRQAEYQRSGHEAILTLEHVLRSTGRGWAGVGSMLEFACGYGRITRHLVQRMEPGRIVAADILEGGVAHVGERFGVRTLLSTTDPADLPEAFDQDGPHDLIWVGSLFSHLPRRTFGPWLARLYGALASDGLLVFTTHGADKVPHLDKDPSGFTFHAMSESRSLALEDYGSTFVSARAMESIATEVGVEHLARVDRDLWNVQDVWVASRAELPAFAPAAPIARGRVLRSQVDDAGHGWVGGFVHLPAGAGSVEAVELAVGRTGQLVAQALLGPSEELVGEGDGGLTVSQHREWYLEGPVGALGQGQHPVCATAILASGERVTFAMDLLRVPGPDDKDRGDAGAS